MCVCGVIFMPVTKDALQMLPCLGRHCRWKNERPVFTKKGFHALDLPPTCTYSHIYTPQCSLHAPYGALTSPALRDEVHVRVVQVHIVLQDILEEPLAVPEVLRAGGLTLVQGVSLGRQDNMTPPGSLISAIHTNYKGLHGKSLQVSRAWSSLYSGDREIYRGFTCLAVMSSPARD